MSWRYLSALPQAPWPAMPDEHGASVLALLYQLNRSEWLSAEQLAVLQREQLDLVLRHAYETVPFYRRRWGGKPDAAALAQLPVLTRRDLQDHFEELKSGAVPPSHGALHETRTSGSTGAPVRVLQTGVETLFWRALTLRDHAWHGRDLAASLAVIRRGVGHGSSPSWGPATEGLLETGPCLLLEVDSGLERQVDWLLRHSPAYLLTYPSLAAALARAFLQRGAKLPGLREVRTLGEVLDPALRALCREAWGARLTDLYSADEVGYIALQCPEHEHYHVQAESLVVEVLDERGAPCPPGQTGRVAVTTLHNFVMPLVRYDTGDYAELGEPCGCGRGLPVLRRIAGRERLP